MSQSFLSARFNAYVELMKPRLIFLVILSAMTGYFLALGPAAGSGMILWTVVLGISLVSAGSMVLNQWMEREADALMQRTLKRPLPTKRVTPAEALTFGSALSAGGLAVLLWSGHAPAAFLAGVTLFLYIAVYTPLKKRTVWCTLVGAIPGALPTITGWAAAEWPLSHRAWILFAILYLWQMPHFYAISWLWRDDYVRAGFKMLSVNDPKGEKVARHILVYTLLLLPVSLLPVWAGMNGLLYAAGALGLGIFFVVRAVQAVQNIQSFARPVFRASIIYLSLLFFLLVINKK